MHSFVRLPPTLVASFYLISFVSFDAGPARSAQRPANPTGNLPSAAVNVDEIISQFVKSNRRRESLVQRYSAVRRYEVRNSKGKVLAEEVVLMKYQSPGTKSFHVLSAKGSALMRGGLKRMMEGEAKAAGSHVRQESAIDPMNYTINLLGDEPVETYECWALGLVPKRQTKYLIQGKLWVTKPDLGTVKIIGRPAKTPSFWIKHVDFVRQYQRIGEFWLPRRDEIIADISWLGRRIVTIDYADYRINRGTWHDGGSFAPRRGLVIAPGNYQP